ncbi:MAG TPA: glycosyltransferase N-terminal domain-containing protein, partial [Blastocatellia bacterium]|nr:glycosyltransferase N-terminal domain-containing protein [Blastocatellia bacterium]
MYFLYSLLFTAAFLALLPYFVFQAIKNGKYAGSFKQRLGGIPPQAASDKEKIIWIHTVSVGEFLAAQPLITALGREMPDYKIAVSTTTLAGQLLARKRMASHQRDTRPPNPKEENGFAATEPISRVFYFPFDWSFAVRRALNKVNPAAVIILETELWPNFLRHCRRLGVPTVIANGRISERSCRRYSIAGRFFKRVLQDVSLLLMQSQDDADRAVSLGASPERVRICGNIKYDVGVETLAPATSAGDADMQTRISTGASGAALQTPSILADLFGVSDSRDLIVAGSTAPGEEEMVLASLREIKRLPGLEDTRLILAPRNPERFDEVAELLARSGLSFTRRSGTLKRELQTLPDVILLDTIGELASAYQFAAVVFVGGSLVPRGGHN